MNKTIKSKIPPEVQTAIAAALGQYLKDDQLDFQVVSARPVQQNRINLWGLFGRQAIMNGYRRK
ncbi:MAG: hypothetical protein KJ620_06660 [Candidatus Edwardsbacteria bacterium]|nr:hypothetical protein [Candidatus Edwardsbacteria bacterium]MBU1576074.1 hypothetical protein [Candidatus Edwardsbacteria bacterium]MBU2463676.1 hypothetical protein [Candidatus Edwardsbacteria bacterium]MBU2594144.1 hypothetical protein [Candidatus Edwardsbacteria bacterium]